MNGNDKDRGRVDNVDRGRLRTDPAIFPHGRAVVTKLYKLTLCTLFQF